LLGGGIYYPAVASTLTLFHSIVSGNLASAGDPNIYYA